jgi:hypothetical protein
MLENYETEEKARLAQAIGLEYPSNPNQINKALLVLAYLLGKGMEGVKNIIVSTPQLNAYSDNFSQEIHTVYHKSSADIYVNSKTVDPETNTPIHSLGTEEDAKLGVIEYKIRRELLTLMQENPTKIDELEQRYDAQDKPTPFGWVRQIKTGYFNVLLGGKNRNEQNNRILRGPLERLNRANRVLDEIPAGRGGDTISKG